MAILFTLEVRLKVINAPVILDHHASVELREGITLAIPDIDRV